MSMACFHRTKRGTGKKTALRERADLIMLATPRLVKEYCLFFAGIVRGGKAGERTKGLLAIPAPVIRRSCFQPADNPTR